MPERSPRVRSFLLDRREQVIVDCLTRLSNTSGMSPAAVREKIIPVTGANTTVFLLSLIKLHTEKARP